MVVALAVAPAAAQEVIELPGQDRMINANFEELYRVGSFDGDEWETFGEIGGTAFDDAGNLYVFDRQASRVVVVDPQGNFLRDFGDAGEGPGEFRMSESAWSHAQVGTDFMHFQPDDGLAASEATEARVLYGDGALYVFLRAHDSAADSIASQLTPRSSE